MKKKIITFLIIFSCFGISFYPGTIANTIPNSPNNNQNLPISDFFFDLYIKTLMKIGHKPSIAAAIIHNDDVVWSQAYGYYDIEQEKKATIDTLYLQASVSKTVTATALMQLYDKGLFELDDDVNDYLPFELRNPNHPEISITIKMILSHHSSLAYDNLFWICLSYLPGDPDVTGYPHPWLENYLVPGGSAYSSSTWTNDKPGEKYYYANIGFSIIAYLVELLSGQNFNEYCKEHIFQPLDMPNSGFRLKDHNVEDIAVPYEYKNNQYFRHPHYGIHVLYPAITLRTSVEEFSHFIIAHMNGGIWNNVRILNESTVELMHTAHYSPRERHNYGLGWTITNRLFGKDTYGHSGGYVGVHDLVTIIPDDNIAVILFSNELDSELLATRTERKAFNAINDALFRKAYRIAS
jgi:CubicO group peptidase (beta-lactamase class C family)